MVATASQLDPLLVELHLHLHAWGVESKSVFLCAPAITYTLFKWIATQ
jgi:hypothetical protein